MSIHDEITKEPETIAPKLVVYGWHGVGKSTFGASLPHCLFVRTEDGLRGNLGKTPKLPVCQNYNQFVRYLEGFYEDPGKYKSLVIDSIDWAEKLIFAHVAQEFGKTDVSEVEWGRGYGKALGLMRETLQMLDDINHRHSVLICLLGHAKIYEFKDPAGNPYSRYGLALYRNADGNKACDDMVYQWADCVLFANYETYTKKVGEKFGKEQHQGVGTGERIMHTEERPAYHAKNRYSLPESLPFSWQELSKHLFK